jgi:hypothetical protein
MVLKIEGIVDDGVHAQKLLGGSSRLGPLQLAFAPSQALSTKMGVVSVARRLGSERPLLAHCAAPL